MRNKVLTFIGFSLICLALLSFAQGEKPTFADRAGNMKVYGLKSWRTERQSDKRISFKGLGGEGRKIRATWVKPSLELTMSTITGIIEVDAKGAYVLGSADLSGGVTAVSKTEVQSATITSANAHYDGTENSVSTKESITVDRADTAKTQLFHAQGTGGHVVLSEGGEVGGIASAKIQGPVTMLLRGVRLESGKKTPYRVTGSAALLTYSGAARTITLTGNVVLSGDDPLLGGDVRATKAVITLDAAGIIQSVDFEGEPGETVVRDKKGGGG